MTPMAVERKVVVGLEDLKAVLECRNCKARVTISPDRARIPRECPAGCGASWLSAVQDNANFLDNLSKIRAQIVAQNPATAPADWPKFRLLLEFDEPDSRR